MRWWIFNQEQNGLADAGAIVRVGRRVYIDLDKFECWIDRQNKIAGADSVVSGTSTSQFAVISRKPGGMEIVFRVFDDLDNASELCEGLVDLGCAARVQQVQARAARVGMKWPADQTQP